MSKPTDDQLRSVCCTKSSDPFDMKGMDKKNEQRCFDCKFFCKLKDSDYWGVCCNGISMRAGVLSNIRLGCKYGEKE